MVESHLINPLSRALFDLNVAENGTLKVVDIRDNGSIYELECEVL